MRILLAEDETTTRLRVQSYLKQWGYEVVATKNGKEALERFEQEGFELVVSDWEMPEMNGPDLVREIRAKSPGRYVYVLMLTARSEKEDIVEGMEAGADDFLTKPFDRNELRVRIRAGVRIIELEQDLAARNDELGQANQQLAVVNRSLEDANARMKHDLEAASEIQRAFLPTAPPVVPGLEFAWTYEPCDELGGDTLNIIRLDEENLGLYLIDVAGHGVPAALLSVTLSRVLTPSADGTSMLKKPSGAAPGYRIIEPSEVAATLNERFAWNEEAEQYFTLFYGIVNARTRIIRYVLCGHPSPIYVPPNGEPTTLEGNGFPVGLIEDAEFEDQEMQLGPGDRIYIHSDGIPEAEGQGDQLFGDDRMMASLASDREAPAADVIANLLGTLEEWRGDRPVGDDISLLSLAVK